VKLNRKWSWVVLLLSKREWQLSLAASPLSIEQRVIGENGVLGVSHDYRWTDPWRALLKGHWKAAKYRQLNTLFLLALERSVGLLNVALSNNLETIQHQSISRWYQLYNVNSKSSQKQLSLYRALTRQIIKSDKGAFCITLIVIHNFEWNKHGILSKYSIGTTDHFGIAWAI